MQEIDLQFRTMFADLVQQSLDDRFLSDFPPDGNFVRVAVKDKFYGSYSVICWYGPIPIAPRIMAVDVAFCPKASSARRQPR